MSAHQYIQRKALLRTSVSPLATFFASYHFSDRHPYGLTIPERPAPGDDEARVLIAHRLTPPKPPRVTDCC
jgi:hypothetical protein